MSAYNQNFNDKAKNYSKLLLTLLYGFFILNIIRTVENGFFVIIVSNYGVPVQPILGVKQLLA
jgi:hypothetical protein